jgi:Fic/DOC family
VSTVYLDIEDLLTAADAALAPVQPKIRDIGLLESALARPQASAFGVDAYASMHEKAAALLESLARKHEGRAVGAAGYARHRRSNRPERRPWLSISSSVVPASTT